MKTKRLPIAIGLFLAILAFCSVALWDLWQQLDGLETSLTALRNTSIDQQQLLVERSQLLVDQWDTAESHFVLYVNHDTLDHITQMVAELPALAQFEESSHLYSHFDAISALLDDLWQSSLPTYRTLL